MWEVMKVPSRPMLTADRNTHVVPVGLVAEPKYDGYRAFVACWADGRVLIQSRSGTDMTTGFPEIAEAARLLSPRIGDVLLDGELVVWHDGRLAFELLQPRLGAKPATAKRLAAKDPASFQVFDVLHAGEESLISQPYRERRAVLEALFAELKLGDPWRLCPATTDPETIGRWLAEWVPTYGIEGVVWKRPDSAYRPGRRGWLKYRLRWTTEAVVGGVTGTIAHPQDLLMGRFDRDGRLRYVGRSTPLTPAAAAALGRLLTEAAPGHPWAGKRFSASWRSRESIAPVLVEPQIVAEISADTAQEGGKFRHLVKFVRIRAELHPTQVPKFDEPDESAGGCALA
jgi:ATP-dependent DNA ligase